VHCVVHRVHTCTHAHVHTRVLAALIKTPRVPTNKNARLCQERKRFFFFFFTCDLSAVVPPTTRVKWMVPDEGAFPRLYLNRPLATRNVCSASGSVSKPQHTVGSVLSPVGLAFGFASRLFPVFHIIPLSTLCSWYQFLNK
jgi:hypothetical protein